MSTEDTHLDSSLCVRSPTPEKTRSDVDAAVAAAAAAKLTSVAQFDATIPLQLALPDIQSGALDRKSVV